MWFPVVALGAGLVVTLVVIALQSPTEHDPSTPEGTVQRYLRAVVDGDHRSALEHVDASLGCRVADFRFAWVPPSLAVRLVGTDVAGDRAEVDLALSENSGPFGAGFEVPATLVLERHDGGWVIVETPWPLYHCEGEVDG